MAARQGGTPPRPPRSPGHPSSPNNSVCNFDEKIRRFSNNHFLTTPSSSLLPNPSFLFFFLLIYCSIGDSFSFPASLFRSLFGHHRLGEGRWTVSSWSFLCCRLLLFPPPHHPLVFVDHRAGERVKGYCCTSYLPPLFRSRL